MRSTGPCIPTPLLYLVLEAPSSIFLDGFVEPGPFIVISGEKDPHIKACNTTNGEKRKVDIYYPTAPTCRGHPCVDMQSKHCMGPGARA